MRNLLLKCISFIFAFTLIHSNTNATYLHNSRLGELPFTLVNIHGWFAKDQTSFCLLNLVQSLQSDAYEKMDYSSMIEHQKTDGNLSYFNDFYYLKGPEQYLSGLHATFRHDYKKDLRALFCKLREKKSKDGKKILIYTHCNGGAKLFSCPELIEENRDIIDAIIIESAPTNFEETAYGGSKFPLYYMPFIGRYLAKLISLYVYGRQLQPIALLREEFMRDVSRSLNIPILLMHSKTDTLVPCTQSMKLYETLRSFNPETYLAVCPSGTHARLLSTKDQPTYNYVKRVWNAFLTKYGFINSSCKDTLHNNRFSIDELQKAYSAHAVRRYFWQMAVLAGSGIAYHLLRLKR